MSPKGEGGQTSPNRLQRTPELPANSSRLVGGTQFLGQAQRLGQQRPGLLTVAGSQQRPAEPAQRQRLPPAVTDITPDGQRPAQAAGRLVVMPQVQVGLTEVPQRLGLVI